MMKKSNLIIRTLVALPLIAALVLALFYQKWFLRILIIVFMLISQYEMVHAASQKVKNINHYLPFIVAGLIPPTMIFFGYSYVFLIYALAFFWLIVESVLVKGMDFNTMVVSIFTTIYPSMLFACLFAVALTLVPGIRTLMLLMIYVTAVMTDTAAYLIGSWFGKHQLSPISPNKSVEGSIAGLLFGFIVVMVLGLFSKSITGMDIRLIHFVILGIALPPLVQVGDLFASMVKRHFELKDFSNIFPGHGGVLDRLDSSLFICPVVFLYFTLIFGVLLK